MTAQIPQWLKDIVGQNKAALRKQAALSAQDSLDKGALHTVCVEAKCPNRGECFNCGDATVMILGDICTRRCRFCAVHKGRPLPPDAGEPARVAEMVKNWHLKYLVLTSPTRDDLTDGGAAHFAAVMNAVYAQNPLVLCEPLIPDFKGSVKDLQTVLNARPAVLAHNIETVESLSAHIRGGAEYRRSLTVLENAKKLAPDTLTKSGLMVGLGETDGQMKQTLQDLRNAGVDLLTIGQYLSPSKAHHPVERYPEPGEYKAWEEYALSIGFKGAACGPLVRSSYKAGALFRQATRSHAK